MKKLPNTLLDHLAAYLKTLRLRRQWTREELAAHANINVYTLKHFERTGQISLERFLSLCQSLDILEEFVRAMKPRERINIQQWALDAQRPRQRGRRRIEHLETEIF